MAVLALSSGDDEYTPYGRLFISIAIQLAFTFQGGRFSDGLELVLRGARPSRPVLGRFLTINRYLLINQDEIPPSLSQGSLPICLLQPGQCYRPRWRDWAAAYPIIVAAIVGAITANRDWSQRRALGMNGCFGLSGGQ
jgi:hypothetical protein